MKTIAEVSCDQQGPIFYAEAMFNIPQFLGISFSRFFGFWHGLFFLSSVINKAVHRRPGVML